MRVVWRDDRGKEAVRLPPCRPRRAVVESVRRGPTVPFLSTGNTLSSAVESPSSHSTTTDWTCPTVAAPIVSLRHSTTTPRRRKRSRSRRWRVRRVDRAIDVTERNLPWRRRSRDLVRSTERFPLDRRRSRNAGRPFVVLLSTHCRETPRSPLVGPSFFFLAPRDLDFDLRVAAAAPLLVLLVPMVVVVVRGDAFAC